MKNYVVDRLVNHNNELLEIGRVITLDDKAAKPLLESKSISPEPPSLAEQEAAAKLAAEEAAAKNAVEDAAAKVANTAEPASSPADAGDEKPRGGNRRGPR